MVSEYSSSWRLQKYSTKVLKSQKKLGRESEGTGALFVFLCQVNYIETHSHCAGQVLKLLDSIGMKQYSEVFQEERINGEVLADMDDEMMQSDLGINSKLHRMKLMKVRREVEEGRREVSFIFKLFPLVFGCL